MAFNIVNAGKKYHDWDAKSMNILMYVTFLTAISMFIPENAMAFKKVRPQYACGPLFGAMGVELKNGATRKQLADAIANREWARMKYKLSLWDDQNRDASVYARIRKPGPHNLIFPVPQGSEAFIAKELLKTGLVKSAGLPGAGCGGDEYVVLTTKISTVGDLRNAENLKSFVQSALNKMIDTCGKSLGSTCGQVRHLRSRVARIDPHFPSVVFELISASELTRGTQRNNVWDKVEVHTRLWRSDAKSQRLWIHTEKYRSARKSKKRVPTKHHFSQPSGAVQYEREARIAITLGEQASVKRGVSCIDATLNAENREVPSNLKCSTDEASLRNQFYFRYEVQ